MVWYFIHNLDLAFNIILMRFQAAALLAALALVPTCAKRLKIPDERPDISSPPPSPLQSLAYPIAVGEGKFTYSTRTGAGVT
jgi:hypothetical protein